MSTIEADKLHRQSIAQAIAEEAGRGRKGRAARLLEVARFVVACDAPRRVYDGVDAAMSAARAHGLQLHVADAIEQARRERAAAGPGEWVVLTSSAKMPAKCWGRYRHAALCFVDAGEVPAMLSARARGMREVRDMRARLNVGEVTPRAVYRLGDKPPAGRCAFSLAVRALLEEAANLSRVAVCAPCQGGAHCGTLGEDQRPAFEGEACGAADHGGVR